MPGSKARDASAENGRRERSKPEVTEADKALLEAEPDWSRMDAIADRLLSTPPKPDRQAVMAPKRRRAD